MAGLTKKQEGFAQDYVKLKDASASYRNNYDCSRMTPKSINENASKLLSHAKIAPRIAELEAEVKKIAKDEFDLDAKWLLKRLYDEVTADEADLYDEKGELKPIREWPQIWRTGIIGLEIEQQFKTVDGKKEPAGYVTKVKIPSDRNLKRLELIGKHVDIQAFLTKKELSIPDGVEVKQRSDVDIARRLAFLLTGAAEKIGNGDDEKGQK